MINTKDNIYAVGFDKEYKYVQYLYGREGIANSIQLIYSGKTSDIPEEIAKECVQYEKIVLGYIIDSEEIFDTAKDAVLAALTKPDGTIYEFCIIFKK